MPWILQARIRTAIIMTAIEAIEAWRKRRAQRAEGEGKSEAP
jgi:hypothetical protein